MSGVQITGLIKPLNGASFPVWEDIDGWGGYRTVDTNTIRDAIPSGFRKEGMLVYSKLTKAVYALLADLVTWVIFATFGLTSQSAWFLDSIGGSDNNDGKTSLTALRTSEELSNRICPNFQQTSFPSNASVTVTVAAGAYGSYDFNVSCSAVSGGISAIILIQGTLLSSANITLSSVTNTVIGNPGTRGEITTAAGTFLSKLRVRSTSGAGSGAQAYVTNLVSATDAQITTWYLNTVGSNPAIANGTTVVTDTLQCSCTSLNVRSAGQGAPYVQLRNHSITSGALMETIYGGRGTGGGSTSIPNSPGGASIRNCDISGIYSGSMSHIFNRIVGATQFIQGQHNVYGCVAQATLQVGLNATVNAGEQISLAVDGGNIQVGSFVQTVGSTAALMAGASRLLYSSIEFENGNASPAIEVFPGAIVNGNQIWGAQSAAYATGVKVHAGAGYVVTGGTMANAMLLNATQNAVVGGRNLTFAQLPWKESEQGAYICQENDAGTDATPVYVTNQSANIGATNLFAAAPRKGSFRVPGYISITTASGGTGAGSVTLNVIYTDDSGVAQTKPIVSIALPAVAGGAGAILEIETNGATNVQYSVTGIITAGALVYSARVGCSLDSNGS